MDERICTLLARMIADEITEEDRKELAAQLNNNPEWQQPAEWLLSLCVQQRDRTGAQDTVNREA